MKNFTLLLVLFAFFFSGAIFAQKKLLTGTVINKQDGKPVIGATVAVKGTTTATLTNIEGKFELPVSDNDKTLVITFVGMKTQEIAIGTTTYFDVKFEPDVFNLDQVVVTAIGIPRESKALGYSVQDVSGDAIAGSHDDDILNSEWESSRYRCNKFNRGCRRSYLYYYQGSFINSGR